MNYFSSSNMAKSLLNGKDAIKFKPLKQRYDAEKPITTLRVKSAGGMMAELLIKGKCLSDCLVPLVDISSSRFSAEAICRYNVEKMQLIGSWICIKGKCYGLGLDKLRDTNTIYLCVSLDEAITLYRQYKAPVFVALNTNNLRPVGHKIRHFYTNKKLVVSCYKKNETCGEIRVRNTRDWLGFPNKDKTDAQRKYYEYCLRVAEFLNVDFLQLDEVISLVSISKPECQDIQSMGAEYYLRGDNAKCF